MIDLKRVRAVATVLVLTPFEFPDSPGIINILE
jgi:hypothetical protein